MLHTRAASTDIYMLKEINKKQKKQESHDFRFSLKSENQYFQCQRQISVLKEIHKNLQHWQRGNRHISKHNANARAHMRICGTHFKLLIVPSIHPSAAPNERKTNRSTGYAPNQALESAFGATRMSICSIHPFIHLAIWHMHTRKYLYTSIPSQPISNQFRNCIATNPWPHLIPFNPQCLLRSSAH